MKFITECGSRTGRSSRRPNFPIDISLIGILPDKAVDLIDEATSSLRMEIDSMPAEIDQLEREKRKLEIEKEALKKEKEQRGRRQD